MNNSGGLGARLETAALAWILLGTLLIVGLVAAFGWPWNKAAAQQPRPQVPPMLTFAGPGAKATGWLCLDTHCWSVDSNGDLIAPLHGS